MDITLCQSPKYVTYIGDSIFLTNLSNNRMWVMSIELSECVKIQ